MNELLSPNLKDISAIFERDFVGMTIEPIELKSLLNARDGLLKILKTDLTNEEKNFLIAIKEGNPKWDLLGIEGIENLPGLQWKLSNIQKMSKEKRLLALDKLKRTLSM